MLTSAVPASSKRYPSQRIAVPWNLHSAVVPIDLTMNCYTAPKLLDVAGDVESLVALPLGPEDRQSDSALIALSPTGTDNLTASPLVPVLVPTTGKSCMLASILDMITAVGENEKEAPAVAVSAYRVKRKDPLTSTVNGSSSVEPKGIEPSTYWLQTNRSPK